MATPLLPIILQLLDDNGNPQAGKIRVYDAGTTNVHDVFTEPTYTTTHSQPIVADSAGRFTNEMFVDPSDGDFKVQFISSADVVLIELDNISPAVSGTVAITQGGTGATTASAARTALSVPSQAQHDAVDTRVTTAETTISNYIDTAHETLTWASSIEIDHTSHSTFDCTLAGATSFTITGLRDGGVFELLLIQDGTGNRTATFSADFDFADDIIRVKQTASAKTLIRGKVIDGVVYCKVQSATPVLAAAFGKKNTGVATTATASAWTTLALDTGTLYDDGTVVSGATSNVFTLPAGEYRITAQQSIDNVGGFSLRLRDSGDTTTYGEGLAVVASESLRGGVALLDTMPFTIAANTSFVLQYYCSSAGALGSNNSANGMDSLVTYIAVERYS